MKVTNTSAVFVHKENGNDNKSLLKESIAIQMITLQTLPTLFISVFLGILFLQSGIDKAVDWRSNLVYHSKQFALTPMRNFTKPLLIFLTFFEIACGLVAITGIVIYFLKDTILVCSYASVMAAMNFIFLFFGLRISKDYKGAAGLVPYFIVSILGIFFSC